MRITSISQFNNIRKTNKINFGSNIENKSNADDFNGKKITMNTNAFVALAKIAQAKSKVQNDRYNINEVLNNFKKTNKEIENLDNDARKLSYEVIANGFYITKESKEIYKNLVEYLKEGEGLQEDGTTIFKIYKKSNNETAIQGTKEDGTFIRAEFINNKPKLYSEGYEELEGGFTHIDKLYKFENGKIHGYDANLAICPDGSFTIGNSIDFAYNSELPYIYQKNVRRENGVLNFDKRIDYSPSGNIMKYSENNSFSGKKTATAKVLNYENNNISTYKTNFIIDGNNNNISAEKRVDFVYGKPFLYVENNGCSIDLNTLNKPKRVINFDDGKPSQISLTYNPQTNPHKETYRLTRDGWQKINR